MKYLILLLIFFQSLLVHADAVEINGANLAEKRIRWVWQTIGTMISACSFDKVNCSDVKYAAVIKSVWNLVPTKSDFDVQAWQNQLLFKHESEFAFESDQGETHRIAMTGSQPGSIIYFNLDRIEVSPSVAYDYDFYLGILVHELVHHTGIKDDQQRLPDQVGAYLASYFKARFLASAQAVIPGQNLSFNVFNYDAPMNWSIASFEMGTALYDVKLAENGMTNPCNSAMAFVTKQKIERPRWRVSQLSLKQRNIILEGTALAENTCSDMFGSSKDPYTKTILWKAKTSFHYDSTMNESNWDQLVPQLQLSESSFGPTDQPDLVNLAKASTYTLKSVVSPAKEAGPSRLLSYEFEFADNLKTTFDSCIADMTSEDWEWSIPGTIPKTITIENCKVVNIDATQRKVVVTYQVPSSVVTLPLQLYGVILYSKNNFFVAYPSRPVLTMINGNVAKNLSPMKVTFNHVQPLAQLGGQALINSFVTDKSDQFGVQIEVGTTADVLRADFEVLILVSHQGELASSPYNGPFNADKILLKNMKKTLDSKLTMDLNYEIPRMISSASCYGIKFDSFSVLTSQLEQVTVPFSQRYESFVMSPRILQ